MPPRPILEPVEIPHEVLVDREGIRKWNPQRFEMEQLTAITLLDDKRMLVAGYYDTSPDDFRVKGHMPGTPLMPGVLMCEAAAQLCSYYCRHFGILSGDFIGFGGMDEVRFRGAVTPGQRLWIVGHTQKHSTRRMQFEMQGFVEGIMVFNGIFIGVPLHGDRISGD